MKSAGGRSLLYRSRLSWRVWRRAVSLIVADADCSAHRLQNELGIGSYRTAWRLSLRVRFAMGNVRWPMLSGTVGLNDYSGVFSRSAPSVWVAAEDARRGLVAAWCNRATLTENIDEARLKIGVAAVVMVPPSGQFRPLGQTHRVRVANQTKPNLPGIFLDEMRDRLIQRRQRRVSPDTLECYLGEMVFRHNVRALGWSRAAQTRAVLNALRVPSA